MPRNTLKRKQFRRKFKRRAAALAGAAIMTGAALSGIPTGKAIAAENPNPNQQAPTVQTSDTTRPPGYGWHQHRGWPGSNDNQGYVDKNGQIYYRGDAKPYRQWYMRAFGDPAAVVQANAAAYGFDSTLDQFTVLTVNRHTALVEVRQHDTGKLYNVILHRTGFRGWVIDEVRAL